MNLLLIWFIYWVLVSLKDKVKFLDFEIIYEIIICKVNSKFFDKFSKIIVEKIYSLIKFEYRNK